MLSIAPEALREGCERAHGLLIADSALPADELDLPVTAT